MNSAQPDISDALALHNAGHTLDAIALYLAVLSRQPDDARLLSLLGIAFLQIGQPREGSDFLKRSLEVDPHNPRTLNNLGIALKDLMQLDEAVSVLDTAIIMKPDYAEAYISRAAVLQKLNSLKDALADLNKAIAINPNNAVGYNNRGVVLKDLERPSEALASYDQAILLKRDYAEAHNNRAIVLQGARRLSEALAGYDEAISINPGFVEAHWCKALLLLLSGNYQDGWDLYEWRLKLNAFRNNYPQLQTSAWHASDNIDGKRILIYSEQGFGDIIQFCRYLPKVQSLGGKIILDIPRSLISFISTLRCDMTVIAEGDQPPDFDIHCPLMSLPHIFRTTVETIPAEIPYLFPEQDKVSRWQVRLGRKEKLRVGLAWSGSRTNRDDGDRSIKIEYFIPLLDLPIEWHSLQKERQSSDLEVLECYSNVCQHQDELADFSDTAALIECMDLVITVDTSIAHVAGSIGKSVWILLPFSPDYRWMLDQVDSPWYPTARLFRQPVRGDWSTVVESVRERLVTAKEF